VTQVTARRHCGSSRRLTRGRPEHLLLEQRPAQQLSGEGTDGFTQFSGLAGMMLVGAGSVPACCQGNQAKEKWCALCRCLSQLRRAARVHRPAGMAAAARHCHCHCQSPASTPLPLPWHQHQVLGWLYWPRCCSSRGRQSTQVRRLPQTQGALAAAAGWSCSVIVIAAPGSVNETQRISSARSALHCR